MTDPLEEDAIEDIYPLSPMQQGMLFHTLSAPESGVYLLQTSYALRGRLDEGAFRRAWERVIARHPILRTALVWEGLDEPVQAVLREVELPWAAHDWRGAPAEAQRARLDALLRADRAAGFDLSAAPLMRLTLVRLADDAYSFVWSRHHLLLDGWSIAVALRELFACYEAFARGDDPRLDRPRPYRDYIAWLLRRDPAASERFWRGLLRGFTTPTALASDRAPGRVFTGEGGFAEHAIALAPQATAALDAWARARQITLGTLIQGAWALALSRFAGADDVVFGTTVFGRPADLPGVEAMVGLFVNALPVRACVALDRPLLPWLRELQAQQAAAREHEHTPLAQIQAWSEIPRGLPLFETDVAFENYLIDDALRRTVGGLEIAGGSTFDRTNYPLTLFGVPGDALALRIAYDSSRFDSLSVARLAGFVRAALDRVATGAAERLADLALPAAHERHQLLVEWNDAAGARGQGPGVRGQKSGDLFLHELFAAQAARTPDAVAVACGGAAGRTARGRGSGVGDQKGVLAPGPRPLNPEQRRRDLQTAQHAVLAPGPRPLNPEPWNLSYGALDARANQLARYLRRAGAGPDVRVGVYMARSAELVVALLGVLKAGSAYVPLDPSYPTERIRVMLEDSGARLLVTKDEGRRTKDESAHASLVTHHSSLVNLAADWLAIAAECADAPAIELSAESLAYVIYTSGSTGTPKGVMATHGGLANYLRWCAPAYAVAQGRGAPVHSPIGFDLTITSLFAPLIVGGRVDLLPESVAGEALAAALAQADDFSLVKITPAHLEALGQRMGPGRAAGRTRAFVIGGEALHGESLAFWRANAPATRLINEYGPTEAVVGCCAYELPADRAPSGPIPIGRPIAGARIYLLDRSMHPVPLGAPGEVYIGGPGLARGYLGRPDLTAAVFLPNPFAPTTGDVETQYFASLQSPIAPLSVAVLRLYKTGDLARWLPDGNLAYLGRIDEQAKIRGYRVEPGEVAAALVGHPAVREALVVAAATPGAAGSRQLVAYVVAERAASDPARPAEVEQVAQWRQVFEDEVGSFSPPQAEPAFNLAGWNSSYTGRPLPAEQMREWVEATVARIQALRPRRVLEIGCGTGLLLFRVAPGCERYVGVDFAHAALAYVRAQMAARPLPQVRLLRRAAHDLADLDPESFDLVIINSVAQYFPSVAYLLGVLDGAARITADGGAVFVGDLRSLPLLEAFHTSVELARAPDDLATARLRQRIYRRARQDAELAIDPALFAALGGRIARASGARTLLRRGRSRNELTGFRYDALLRVGAPAPTDPPATERMDWAAQDLTLERLARLLAERRPERLELAGVPNARLEDEQAARALLDLPDPPATVGELRALVAARRGAGVDPERMWALAEDLGYAADLRWTGDGRRGDFDALLRRPDAPAPWQSTPGDGRRWGGYANDPLAEKQARALAPELRAHLRARLPEFMLPASFVFLEALPLTPHGKIDPAALPPPDQALPELEPDFVAPRTPAERALAEVWAHVLGLEQAGGQALVSVHSNFFELGGDSIHSIQVVARAQQAGLRLTPKQIFLHPTIAELALVADPARADEPDEQANGELPLTPIQRWFFEQELLDPQHFNQSLLLDLWRAPGPATLARALRKLIARHDALRLRFSRADDGWRQVVAPVDPGAPLAWLDLAALPADRRAALIERCAADAQASLDLERGPIVRAALFGCGPAEPARLLLVVHHLAIDGVSWRILLAELADFCARDDADPPPRTASFRRWAERLRDYARSDELRAELPYWLSMDQSPPARLPLDHDAAPDANDEASARTLHAALSADETRALLHDAPAAYQTRLDDLLLAALGRACSRWTGERALLIDLEAHGRADLLEDLNLSRTVGWFTALYPLRLEVGADDPPGAAIKSVKEQIRRAPHGGVGYGALRYLCDDLAVADRLRAMPRADIRFNNLGQLDHALPDGIGLATEASGPAISPRNRRAYALEVGASVAGGRLRLALRYSERLHARATAERLLDWFVAALRELLEHCLAPAAGGYTPSDFPQAGLSQQELDDLLGELGDF